MENLTLVAALAFLAVTGIVTQVTQFSWLGFALSPLPLLFYRMDAFRMVLLTMAGYILFYEGSQAGSNFLFFNTPDSMMLVFIAMTLFFSRGPGSISIPVSAGLVPLYAFILYGLALSVAPIIQFGFEFYVMRDVKCLLFLALVPLLCRRDEPLFDPKNIFRILVAIVGFTSLHSLIELAGFFATGNRLLTWNEIYFSDAVLLIPILLTLNPEKRTRMFLYACLAICLLGLLATQTRGLWLSTLITFFLYGALRLARSKTIKIGAVVRSAQIALAMLIAGEAILRLSLGVGILEFIQSRMMAHSNNELINPYSSLGYRIHESLVVWEKRTWFGHGSGARLYLYFTQMGMSKFINWWSIHSEYFEILHKYGFVGLGIFMVFLIGLIRRAYRIAMHGKAFPSAMGFLAFSIMINHCLVSITSGYLIRENIMLLMVLMVGIVERYYPRVFPDHSK